MKKYCIFFVIGFLANSLSSHAHGAAAPGPSPIKNFEVQKYTGTWYEIGSIRQSFEKGCVCTRASYSEQSDGKLSVLNECRLESPTGRLKLAHGRARFRGDLREGDLEVSFFLWFYGSYRIIALDPNYQWSLVSNDRASTLWILSRDPNMPDAQVALLLDQARSLGVDPSNFTRMSQENCWPSSQSKR